MPPHTASVLRYHTRKSPIRHASAKLLRVTGPAGVSEAISAGTPGRNDATAIQANGTAHSKAVAPTAISPNRRPSACMPSAFIVDATLERAERQQRERQQRRHADHGRRRGEPGIVVLCRLLVDVIQDEVGRV